MTDKFLLIEDDNDIAHAVCEALSTLGRQVEHLRSGETALARLADESYELIVLDINLPGRSGIEVCKAIRRDNVDVPIIMLTSRVEELDKILALELGADDYVTKPFSVRELIARVNALLRRSTARAALPSSSGSASALGSKISIGDVLIDVDRHEVYVSGEKAPITGMEWDILLLLASNPGRTFSRTELMELLWGGVSESYESTINARLSRLRLKLEPEREHPRYILTIRGVGYRFAAPDEFAPDS